MAKLLPDEVIWRGKAKFWEGAGSTDLLLEYAENEISNADFVNEREIGNGMPILVKEELIYYRFVTSTLDNIIPIEKIGRTGHA
jgi:asparagine synthase (glutamine-hydrolysing)